MFTEHTLTHAYLASKPQENVQWSQLCVSQLEPLEQTISSLEEPRPSNVIASADTPPGWVFSYFNGVPFLGPLLSILGNAMRYNVKVEDCADFMANDLSYPSSEYINHRVGLISAGKGKRE